MDMDEYTNQYSEEAQKLLIKWNCMNKNMQSALMRFKQLGKQAAGHGPDGVQKLNRLIQQERLSDLYEEIGRRLRSFSDTAGVEKHLPDPETLSEFGGIARFVDFQISEEALPEFDRCIDEMNELIITLTAKLCLIKI